MEISILHKKLYQNNKYKNDKKQYQNYKTSIFELLWESVWVKGPLSLVRTLTLCYFVL